MKPFRAPGTNVLFGRPDNWDDAVNGPCDELPAVVTPTTVTSFWEFDEDEIKEILKSGKLMLVVAGSSMPPVSLSVAIFTE